MDAGLIPSWKEAELRLVGSLESTKIKVMLFLLCNTSPWSFLPRRWPCSVLWSLLHLPEGLPDWGVVDHRWEKHRWHHRTQDKSHTKVTYWCELSFVSSPLLGPAERCGYRCAIVPFSLARECEVLRFPVNQKPLCLHHTVMRMPPDLDSILSYRRIWGSFVYQFTLSLLQVLVVVPTAGGLLIQGRQNFLYRNVPK